MPVMQSVYLAQLVALLHTDKNIDEGKVEHVNMSLTCAEACIRWKKGSGLELGASAVELTHAMGLMVAIVM